MLQQKLSEEGPTSRNPSHYRTIHVDYSTLLPGPFLDPGEVQGSPVPKVANGEQVPVSCIQAAVSSSAACCTLRYFRHDSLQQVGPGVVSRDFEDIFQLGGPREG